MPQVHLDASTEQKIKNLMDLIEKTDKSAADTREVLFAEMKATLMEESRNWGHQAHGDAPAETMNHPRISPEVMALLSDLDSLPKDASDWANKFRELREHILHDGGFEADALAQKHAQPERHEFSVFGR